uniref:Uncharacterized protein n=1 Tax=Cacopsylla melanoneura TaxID=428564 RepID=A0A8D9E899_9HEMI
MIYVIYIIVKISKIWFTHARHCKSGENLLFPRTNALTLMQFRVNVSFSINFIKFHSSPNELFTFSWFLIAFGADHDGGSFISSNPPRPPSLLVFLIFLLRVGIDGEHNFPFPYSLLLVSRLF